MSIIADPRNLEEVILMWQDRLIVIGHNKTYCFCLDEDGYLIFLKRDDEASEYVRDLIAGGDEEAYDKNRDWPANHYDGKVLFKIHTGESRGITITGMFLDALGIDYQG